MVEISCRSTTASTTNLGTGPRFAEICFTYFDGVSLGSGPKWSLLGGRGGGGGDDCLDDDDTDPLDDVIEDG